MPALKSEIGGISPASAFFFVATPFAVNTLVMIATVFFTILKLYQSNQKRP